METKADDNKKGSSNRVDTLYEVKSQLDAGATTNLRNRDGYTILQLAVRNRHYDCLEVLIKDGKAKLDQRGPYVIEGILRQNLAHSE
jgi:ankyrin repeat protein